MSQPARAHSKSPHERARLAAQNHVARSADATARFFNVEAPAIADCCRQMADRFSRGGSLLVMGEGAQASDAQHVAVEFVHPVIVGKRALPAIALTSDVGVMTGSTRVRKDSAFAQPLEVLAKPMDIALALCTTDISPTMRAALAAARAQQLLTVLVTGDSNADVDVDIALHVQDRDPLVVQEVQETLYHVLWELVHVFFESDDARELSTYLDHGSTQGDRDIVQHVQASTIRKSQEICDLRTAFHAANDDHLTEAAGALAARFRRGGKLLTFGNGGSATDAQDAAVDCMAPALANWRALPALALTNDVGVVTAIANDVGFDHVFSRQIAAFGRQHDIALGFSTSGTSRNVTTAMAAAKARGLMTVAFSGGDGGELARSPSVDYCFTARSEHIPRIQEVHASGWHALLVAAHVRLDSPDDLSGEAGK